MVIGLRHGVPLDDDLAVDDRVGDTGAGVFVDVGPGAIGRLPVEELGEQAERAAADSDAPPAVQIDRRTVVGIVGGMVAADARVQEGRELPFLEHQVHHTGDRVRSVLRRRAVAQHVDAIDRARGDRVEIDSARTGAGPVRKRVDERGLVAAPAVHQHERLIG